MALSMLRPFCRLLVPTRLPRASSARSKFYVQEPLHQNPDWLKVGLTFCTTALLWFTLIQEYKEDVSEYKRRNGLE